VKEFEKHILKQLTAESHDVNINFSIDDCEESVEFSGTGYFVTVYSPTLPRNRIILDKPDVRGKLSGTDVGFIAFVEIHQLILECYSYGNLVVPKHREGVFHRDTT